MRIELLTTAHEPAALEYLNRAPYDNVFLTHLIRSDPASRSHGSLYVALEEAPHHFGTPSVRGVVFFGRQAVLAAENDETTAAFVQASLRHRNQRMIVGPRERIIKYWQLAASQYPPPRSIRDRQYVMAVTPETLCDPGTTSGFGTIRVRQARLDEWQEVAENSARMIAGELEYNPRANTGDFGSSVRQMIERGLWWIGEYTENTTMRLCFFCNVGPKSDRTTQLQGIWTPPDLRGRGLATAAFGAICRQLFSSTPTLSLYVNDFNREAIRLYERLGFQTISEFQTILF